MSASYAIFPEVAELLEQHAYPGGQYLLRLRAPNTAAHAQPGQFVHLQCDPAMLQRRPMSLMHVDRQRGCVDILYKIYGAGTQRLSEKQPGARLELLGPIGVPFKLSGYRPRPLLIGGGVGMPPMIFLAEHLRAVDRASQPLVLIGSETPFPFHARPSGIMVSGLPAEVTAAMPLLDDWGIASRLSSLRGYPACYRGHVTELARHYLKTLPAEQLEMIEIFACGPLAMNRAAAHLAQEYGLPCQLSLEEHMACAVGGCAGCTVPVRRDGTTRMERVCVDGPVFDAASVFPLSGTRRAASTLEDSSPD